MKKLLTLAALLWTVSESMAQLTYTHLNSTKTDSNENEWAGKLLDGTGTTKWGQGLSTGDPKWIIFKTSSALIPSEYTLTEANDTPGNNGRQWKKWKIYGGNFTTDAAAAAATGSDGWVLLDQKNCPSNDEFPISANNNSYLQTDFTMSHAGGSSYRYFKIVVEEIRQSGEYMQMGDFCFKTYTTDPTPQVTFTCTAGKKYNDGEGTEKAFDGVTTTKWNTQGGTDCYALFNASAPIYVWGYDIITANDTEIRGRMPKEWKLYGATTNLARDAEGWVELSSFSENSYVQQRNFFKQRFFCDKSKVGTAYQYFRLEIDKPEGDMQISEFQLCYETQPVVTYDWKEGYYHSSTTDRDGETMTKNAVDWQLGEKMEGNNLSGSWITIETYDGKSYPVKSYSFSTQDDGDQPNRAPKTWKVEGSNDNTNWVTIHEVTDADAAARNYVKNVNYTTYEFTPTNTSDAFKFIKLTLNSMKGTGWTQLGEFHVVGVGGCETHTWVSTGSVSATCMSRGGSGYICSVCGAKKLENATALASHSYVDGFCSVCGIIKSDYMSKSKNGDYYEASTPQHLKWLAARMDEKEDGNFKVKLTQDIDLNGSGFQGFSIGNSGIIFKGEFDGQGHWLKNFSISNLGLKQVALFGRTENASIHDLGMYKANVSLSAYDTQNTAIIVGNANKTTINRVAVTGGSKVSGFDHVGSIAGNTQETTTISNCYSDAEVKSSNFQCGGLVGTSSGLTLEKCLFLGSVNGSGGNASGLLSLIESNDATILQNNIMAATKIETSSSDNYHSLVNADGRTATYTNNHVAASTIFKASGSDDTELQTGKTLVFDDINGSNGKTTTDADMKQESFYNDLGWDLTDDWTFHAEGHYPVLKWMVDFISTPAELVAFANKVNNGGITTVALLTADINMSGVAYTPIGTEANKYAGSFDGKGNVVSNISYTSSTQDHVGLFGYVENATIQNTVLDGATITVTTKQNTGGLVGTASASTIQKCAVVNSTITGHDHVAAIVANAIDGTEVRNNYSNATIVSDQYQAGGLVGTIKVATIEKNLFVGTVSNPSGDASGLISRIDAAVSPNPEVRNNMVAAPTITGSSTYAIIKADWNDRPVTFADNYTLNSTDYSTGAKVLKNKDDRNGKQVDWVEATTKDFYETTLGWNFTDDWKFTCGGKYPILKIMADEALPTQDVTVTSAGYATMVAQYDYDFTSAPVETYAVTASATPGYVHLMPVTSAKHGEALLLKGSTDTYTLTATETAKDVTAENLLKAADEDVVSNGTMYALAKIDNVVGFYQVGTAESAVTIPAGKAYLEGVGGSVKAYIFDFDDDPDAISSLLASPEEEGQVYNLAGQRISKMQKGINIVNGKKVMVK